MANQFPLDDYNTLAFLTDTYPEKLREFRSELYTIYQEFKGVEVSLHESASFEEYKRLESAHKEIRARAAAIRELLRKMEQVYDGIKPL